MASRIRAGKGAPTTQWLCSACGYTLPSEYVDILENQWPQDCDGCKGINTLKLGWIVEQLHLTLWGG